METLKRPKRTAATPGAGLTPRRRRLVEKHVGLVAVHLRRHVFHEAKRRDQWEWDELFQEGCLGLVDAAREFRPDRGRRFAAFALGRIRHAVDRAMAAKRAEAAAALECVGGVVRGCAAGAREEAESARRDQPADAESVGHRLRGKYERTVRAAAAEQLVKGGRRTDREPLVNLVVRERLLIPEEHERLPLREIARRTGWSFERVAECEQQIQVRARAALVDDPEFEALRGVARTHPEGMEAAVDERLDEELAGRSAAVMARRLRSARPAERSGLLWAMAEACGERLENELCDRVRRLEPERREQLLTKTRRVGGHGSRADPREPPSGTRGSSKRRCGARR